MTIKQKMAAAVARLQRDRQDAPYSDLDANKLRRLLRSMARRGWCGLPLVTHHGTYWSGQHRARAARAVGVSIPTISLLRLARSSGAEPRALRAICSIPDVDEQAMRLMDLLPTSAMSAYGLSDYSRPG